jgi:hypothetical protein
VIGCNKLYELGIKSMSVSTSLQGRVSERDAGYTVKWVGAQRNVLQGDISGHIALSSLSDLPNLYAVGPAERLRGEVSIFDSVPSISRITDGSLKIETNFNHGACFLVYAQVSAWHRIPFPTAIRRRGDAGDPYREVRVGT